MQSYSLCTTPLGLNTLLRQTSLYERKTQSVMALFRGRRAISARVANIVDLQPVRDRPRE